jgi:hypothetical protein
LYNYYFPNDQFSIFIFLSYSHFDILKLFVSQYKSDRNLFSNLNCVNFV